MLGGGAAGLLLGLRLAEAGQPVTIIEREPVAGGLAAGFRVGEAWLEKFYHHLFGTDETVIGLVHELGLADRMMWKPGLTSVWLGDRAWPLNSAGAVLRFGPLPLADRVRMGAVLALLKTLRTPAQLEGRTATAWLRERMGERAYETVWRPQQSAKFGELADSIAAPWFWARIHDRTTQLGYLRGGFQLLYEALADRFRAAGGDLRLGVEVISVEPTGGGFTVSTSAGDVAAGRVVSTLPTRVTARLVPALPMEWRQRYDWGQAYGAHCLVLALDRSFGDAYWLSILEEGFPFMAVVEHTNYVPRGDYGGRHLVYIGNYRPMDDRLYQQSEAELIEEWTPWLRRINPAFEPGWITDSWVWAAPYAQPIVTVDYRDHIPPFETPLAGLFVCNMFQVYPHDRGQNYSFALAQTLAERLLTA